MAAYSAGHMYTSHPQVQIQHDYAVRELNDHGLFKIKDWEVNSSYTWSLNGNWIMDTDGAHLWQRDLNAAAAPGICIISFRGSSTVEDLVITNKNRVRSGFQVNKDIYDEFIAIQQRMKMDRLTVETCTWLEVTGHSLGGGIAALFSVFMNAVHDPLGWNQGRKRVDMVNAFGPAAAFYDFTYGNYDPNNGAGSNCFRGGMYRTFSAYTGTVYQDGSGILNTAWNVLYLKTSAYDLYATHSEYKACGSFRRSMYRRTPVMDNIQFCQHDLQRYLRDLACPSADSNSSVLYPLC